MEENDSFSQYSIEVDHEYIPLNINFGSPHSIAMVYFCYRSKEGEDLLEIGISKKGAFVAITVIGVQKLYNEKIPKEPERLIVGLPSFDLEQWGIGRNFNSYMIIDYPAKISIINNKLLIRLDVCREADTQYNNTDLSIGMLGDKHLCWVLINKFSDHQINLLKKYISE